jgi:hypothetical protein
VPRHPMSEPHIERLELTREWHEVSSAEARGR